MTLHERLKGPPIGAAGVVAYVHGKGEVSRSRLSKVTRWFTRGVLVGGVRMKLPGVKLGGQWHTSERLLSEWIEATTAGAGGGAEATRTPAERQRDSERAAAQLAAAGW